MHGANSDPFANFNSDPFAASSKKNDDFNDFFNNMEGSKPSEIKPKDEFAEMFGNDIAMSPQTNQNNNGGSLFNEDDILTSFGANEEKKETGYDKIF